MFISGDKRDRRVIICDVFFLEARVGSLVKVARVARQKTSHVYIKPCLFKNYVQITLVRKKYYFEVFKMLYELFTILNI